MSTTRWFLCSVRGPHAGRMEDDIINNKKQESSSTVAALRAQSVNSLPDVGCTGGTKGHGRVSFAVIPRVATRVTFTALCAPVHMLSVHLSDKSKWLLPFCCQA